MFGGYGNPFLHGMEKGKSNYFLNIIQGIIVALAINVTIYFLFILPSQVDGTSMVTTLLDQELLFANKIPTWLGNTDFGKQNGLDYARGDIVILEANYNGVDELLVKRIIGTPGDRVSIYNDQVYINGELLNEPYIEPEFRTYFPTFGATVSEGENTIIIEPNKYFVMGDNRENSVDSRYEVIGLIPRNKIKGVVFMRFWPIEKITFFSNPYQ